MHVCHFLLSNRSMSISISILTVHIIRTKRKCKRKHKHTKGGRITPPQISMEVLRSYTKRLRTLKQTLHLSSFLQYDQSTKGILHPHRSTNEMSLRTCYGQPRLIERTHAETSIFLPCWILSSRSRYGISHRASTRYFAWSSMSTHRASPCISWWGVVG